MSDTEQPLPACCIPSEGAGLAEQLYCAYQQGGPPERAGLSWNDRPCPTWAQLVERAEDGDAGAQGVISKWEAVVASLKPRLVPERLDLLSLVQRAIAYDYVACTVPSVGTTITMTSAQPIDPEEVALADLLAQAGAPGGVKPLGSLRLQRMLREVRRTDGDDA